ncbi:hypothetical protein AJ78_02972 [Emergomyces pasteurianus Ep9510]|uniref:Complex 1 LYR protein domain-containing protein n=1 Tax=Emergomyces pasteurianus Ep9510 TaxID=1447872 RepID=A0A1J9Q9F9_9EURO|nr:hypothetical protein AJ78_02972 [Emergomyces pasteurianus Ep9510]
MSVVTQANSAFQARSLFRSLLRQSRQFAAYNFREYARRRTIDAFREHQRVTDQREIQELMQKGLQNLRMMKRQTVISQFYQLDKLVVEGEAMGKETGNAGGIVRQKDTGAVEVTLCTYIRLSVSLAFHFLFHFLLSLVKFRSSRRSQALAENPPNRTRTGQVDHDVFEGFPVRRWVRQPVVVYQTPKNEQPDARLGGPQALPELPMPRDSHLLTPMSRALLRAARAGCKYIRPAPTEIEDDEKEIKDPDEPVVAPPFERTFTAGKWSLVPRHMEPPEAEFLAKRRPGLSSLYGSAVINTATEVQPVPKPPMRKTKFKKVDPTTGNVSIYEAWVPEGHKVEGEITENIEVIPENSDATVVAESPAPGTVVEGVGVVDTQGVVVAEPDSSMVAPIKKRYPPPKRKAKGTGKGRRKKVMFAPGEGEIAHTTPGGTDASHATGDGPMSGIGQDANSNAMSGIQDEDEDEDDENDGEDSDEGEESASESKSLGTVIMSEHEDTGHAPTYPEKTEPKLEIPEPSSLPIQVSQNGAAIPPRDMSSSPDLPLAAASTNGTTKPSSDEVFPPPQSQLQSQPQSEPQSQPESPAPIRNLSQSPGGLPPVPATSFSDTSKDATINGQEAHGSEALGSEPEVPPENQNGTSDPQTKSHSPANGVNPDAAQHSPPEENAASASTVAAPEPRSATVRFEDGEVDLLGSLEASLNNPNKHATARHHVSPTENGQHATDVVEPDASVRENHERQSSPEEKKDIEMTG